MKRSEILHQQAETLKRGSNEIKSTPNVTVETMGLALVCTALAVILDELADMRKIGEGKMDS